MDDARSPVVSDEAQLADWLTVRLHRAGCPPSLELGEFQLGALSSETQRAIEQHLAGCPLCRQELAFWTEFLVAEPAEQPVAQAQDGVFAALKRLVARLTPTRLTPTETNPPLQPAWGALRGAVGDQLIYEVDDIQIVVDLQSDPANPSLRVIYALVIGLENALPVYVTLHSAGTILAQSEVDEIGNFSFSALNKGTYQLQLRTAAIEVVIEPLLIE